MDFICRIIEFLTSTEHFRVFIIPIITSLATFLLTTVLYQSRKERKAEKTRLFGYLMATRMMRDKDRVKVLNTIDVVFCDCKKVVDAWHRFYESLRVSNDLLADDYVDNEVAMLKAMAKHLKYPKSINERIDKPYFPTWLKKEEDGRAMQDEMPTMVAGLADAVTKYANKNAPKSHPQPPQKKRGKNK